MNFSLFIFISLFSASVVFTNNNSITANELEVLQINDDVVILSGGSSSGLSNNTIYNVFRKHKTKSVRPLLLKLAEIKIVDVQESLSIGRIIRKHFTRAHAFLKNYKNIMVNDIAIKKELKISKQVSIIKMIQLKYKDLFKDPTANQLTLSLKKEGKDNLKELIKPYLKSNYKQIIIEAHTGYEGAYKSNLIESKNRASVIKNYLVSKFDFDPQRIISIGYGESEIIDGSYTMYSESNNRRIVIKSTNGETL